MYIYTCVCMQIFIDVYIILNMYICICMWIYVYVCGYMYIKVCASLTPVAGFCMVKIDAASSILRTFFSSNCWDYFIEYIFFEISGFRFLFEFQLIAVLASFFSFPLFPL